MEHFNYEGVCGVCVLRHVKEELAQAIDSYVHKWLWLISDVKYTSKGTKERSCFKLMTWLKGSVANTQLKPTCTLLNTCAYHLHTYAMVDAFVKECYFS